ncbi:MAG: EVE domain-containing protein [Bacteroidota bacterium]|jgi:predicted RNA-binding protein with PUA-like domain|nr:EVE domain-containing protein [Bacteroidota bacterium]
MQYWLIKSEPESYSWENFEEKGVERWDGIRNFQARNNIKAMQNGDMVLFYHSGKDKAVIGLAQVAGEPYPEPENEDQWFSVDLKVLKKLKDSVSLVNIKSHPELANIALIKQSRLSVMPLKQREFQIIMDMGEK